MFHLAYADLGILLVTHLDLDLAVYIGVWFFRRGSCLIDIPFFLSGSVSDNPLITKIDHTLK